MTHEVLRIAGTALIAGTLAGVICGVAIGLVLASVVGPGERTEPQPVMVARIV